MDEGLIPKHGGYRNLKRFQLARLIYDVTVRFCSQYIERNSGTSKKMELKLTNVARASLEELRLDYEDFLRQRGLEAWPPKRPALVRFTAKRCSTLDAVQAWVKEEQGRNTSELAANAALSLLNLCCHLLDRQLAAQAATFEQEGGFTERLCRTRTSRKRRP